MELTREKLEEMAAVDIRNVDINSLTDLRDIVEVRFQKEGPTIDDKMEEYLRRLAEIHI